MRIRDILFKWRTSLFGPGAPVVPVIRLQGPIAADRRFGRGISLAAVDPLIERAFSLPGIKAVALLINSPGGAVVQSAHITKRLRTAAQEKNIPILAFCEDVAASGGYMLALAGDEIYVDEASIIGSIGVIAGGFGLADLIKSYGIERRVYAAGEKKNTLDPFKPEVTEDVEEFQELLNTVHEIFKTTVRERRGKRLKPGGARARAFSGQVFLGEEAIKIGLADSIGELKSVLKARFGETVRIPLIEARRPLFGRFGSQSALGETSVRGGSDWPSQLVSAVEERLIWSRFGL